MARTAEQLHLAAVDLVNQGKVAAAKRLLTRAGDLAEDANLRARIAGTMAYTLSRTGDLVEAEQLCFEALAAPGIDLHTVAILSGQMGAIAERAGRLDDAERWLGRGIAGLDSDPLGRANLIVNRSLVNMQRRQLSAAAADAARATEMFAVLGLRVDEAQALHNEGYISLLAGDLVTALRQMVAARDVLASLSPVSASIGDVDRAEVLRDAGLTTEAERILARSAKVFGVHQLPQSRAEAELSLANSKLMHAPADAARIASAATRRFRALGNDTWAVRADAVRLRALLAEGGGRGGHHGAPTVEEVETAASSLDGGGFASEAAALRMAFELRRARDGMALSRAVRVPRSASLDVKLLVHEVRAARSSSAGREGEARRHAAAGLDTLGQWQATFGSLDLQTSLVVHGRGLMLAGLASAVRTRRPEVIFEWSERARHLSGQVVPLRPPPDPALAAELAELRMLRADDPTSSWLADARATDLQDRARQRQWSATGATDFQERVTIGEAQSALAPDTALITYVYTVDAMIALLIDDQHAVVIDIDSWPDVERAMPGLRADLDMAATISSGPMATVIRRSLDDRLATLSTALLDQVARATSARRLVITVPGILNGIPWAMLPGMRGRTFTLATSATKWTRGRDAEHVSAGRAGFAVGLRVIRGDEEVDAAASAWASSSVLQGDVATVDAVTRLASEVDVLHVAAHGRHAVDNPLFSGLELADGALFGYDIDLIPQVPETVVLSSCEVGRSSVRWGEEAIGMTRIWLHAGSRCVIAAPVIVADDVACELLGAMHDGLAAGHAPAEALAAASDRTGIIAPFQAHGAGF